MSELGNLASVSVWLCGMRTSVTAAAVVVTILVGVANPRPSRYDTSSALGMRCENRGACLLGAALSPSDPESYAGADDARVVAEAVGGVPRCDGGASVVCDRLRG